VNVTALDSGNGVFAGNGLPAWRVPPIRARAPVLRALMLPSERVEPARVVVPVYVLLPVSARVPLPPTVRPPLPVIGLLIVCVVLALVSLNRMPSLAPNARPVADTVLPAPLVATIPLPTVSTPPLMATFVPRTRTALTVSVAPMAVLLVTSTL